MLSTQTKGTLGEVFVAEHLKNNGFVIREKNFKRRRGEIDIIAQKEDLIVFVEVKMRTTQQFPLASVVNPAKQRKILAAAQLFIAYTKNANAIYRFDVALVMPRNNSFELCYVQNAFTTEEVTTV